MSSPRAMLTSTAALSLRQTGVLAEVFDFTLQHGKRRDRLPGDFSVDLVAEEGDGNTIVIENQVGKEQSRLPRKIITYLAALDARIAMWIVPEARPEHLRNTIDLTLFAIAFNLRRWRVLVTG